MINGDTEEGAIVSPSSDGEENKILYAVYNLFFSHVLLNLFGNGL
jgi:hypothetical protein